jgi:hypothetical protein
VSSQFTCFVLSDVVVIPQSTVDSLEVTMSEAIGYFLGHFEDLGSTFSI